MLYEQRVGTLNGDNWGELNEESIKLWVGLEETSKGWWGCVGLKTIWKPLLLLGPNRQGNGVVVKTQKELWLWVKEGAGHQQELWPPMEEPPAHLWPRRELRNEPPRPLSSQFPCGPSSRAKVFPNRKPECKDACGTVPSGQPPGRAGRETWRRTMEKNSEPIQPTRRRLKLIFLRGSQGTHMTPVIIMAWRGRNTDTSADLKGPTLPYFNRLGFPWYRIICKLQLTHSPL